MPEPGNTLLVWLSGTAHGLVLLVGLLGATLVGWLRWRHTQGASARALWLGAVSILGGVLVWVLFGSLAGALALDPRLWAVPLDRLLGVAMLVALGWTLSDPGFGGRRWRVFLAGGLGATVLAYLSWAPSWAQAFQMDAPVMTGPATLARVWDVWLLLLATAVGIAVLRGPRAARWALGMVVGLAAGTLLELLAPGPALLPVWSRLGTVVAGSFIVMAAAVQATSLRPFGSDLAWPLRPVRRARRTHPPNGHTVSPAASAAAAVPVNATVTDAPTSDLARVLALIERQGQAIGGLTEVVTGLAERIQALEQVPAATAAPIAPAATASRGAVAVDADEPTGALALAPDPDHDLTIAAVAALEAAGGGRGDTALADAGAATMASVLATQAQRYQRALERLPWGVIVVDGDDRATLANPAAARLLHRRHVQSGEPAVALFATPERLGYALHQVRQAPEDTAGGQQINLESPAVRVEIERLRDPVAGHLGAVVILSPRTTDPNGLPEDMVSALTEALRAPMTSILGYSELLGRMSTLSEDQVQRYLRRIDANLGRMRVMLDNLLAALELARTPERPTAHPEPVDIEAAVRSAIGRAQPQFGEKAVAVSVAVNGPLPQASADRQALDQIMDNLLAQAAHRSPQGGDVVVAANIRDDGAGQRAVVISVHDRGNPLSEGSTGVVEIDDGPRRPMALTVVRWLAERQGGRAWAESDAQGARFHVRLPVRRAA